MAKGREPGPSLRESFASFDRDSLSWKTPQLSLVAGLTSCSVSWPPAGMMRNGDVSELATSERRTDAIEPLSLLTGRNNTPSSRDLRPSPSRGTNAQFGRMWPTPAASDNKGSTGRGCRRRQLAEAVALTVQETGPTLYPNPVFVEWLMGFPAGWVTDHNRDT